MISQTFLHSICLVNEQGEREDCAHSDCLDKIFCEERDEKEEEDEEGEEEVVSEPESQSDGQSNQQVSNRLPQYPR